MGIENYEITQDLVVNVKGNVWIAEKHLECIPVQFGEVTGNFHCHRNDLTSLAGAPHTVGKRFDCGDNEIQTLEGGPVSTGQSYNCSNNCLTSLKGGPTKVGYEFNCSCNRLTSLEYAPLEVDNDFMCGRNSLTSLKHMSATIGGSLLCNDNPLIDIADFNFKVGQDLYISVPIEIDWLNQALLNHPEASFVARSGTVEIPFSSVIDIMQKNNLHNNLNEKLKKKVAVASKRKI